jgi:hypothetical protein
MCPGEPWAAQNAACVAMFPAPLPRPGFFGTSLTDFEGCVPAAACPGVDERDVEAAVQRQLAGSASDRAALEAAIEAFLAGPGANSSLGLNGTAGDGNSVGAPPHAAQRVACRVKVC